MRFTNEEYRNHAVSGIFSEPSEPHPRKSKTTASGEGGGGGKSRFSFRFLFQFFRKYDILSYLTRCFLNERYAERSGVFSDSQSAQLTSVHGINVHKTGTMYKLHRV